MSMKGWVGRGRSVMARRFWMQLPVSGSARLECGFPFVCAFFSRRKMKAQSSRDRQTEPPSLSVPGRELPLAPQPANMNLWGAQRALESVCDGKISNSNSLFKRRKWTSWVSGFNRIFLQAFYKGSYLGFLFTDCFTTNKLSTKLYW